MINEILVVLMAISGIGLTVFVFDGAVLNAGLISSLIRPDGYPYFPNGTFDRGPWPKLAGDRYDLTEVLAITLVVRRTRVAAMAIYYPFIVFLLVLLGRVPVFADWRWSSSLVILTGVCFSLTLAAAVILKRAAELARRTSAGKIRLRALRYSNFGKADSKAAMEQLADYVERENRGAFSRVLPTMIFFIITLFGWGLIILLDMSRRKSSEPDAIELFPSRQPFEKIRRLLRLRIGQQTFGHGADRLHRGSIDVCRGNVD